MNSGIIITTALGALEIRTTKVALEATEIRARVGLEDMVVHPMDMVTITDIIITSFEKKQWNSVIFSVTFNAFVLI
jgi:hypothetical protein